MTNPDDPPCWWCNDHPTILTFLKDSQQVGLCRYCASNPKTLEAVIDRLEVLHERESS